MRLSFFRSLVDSTFKQPEQQHESLQSIPALKHSQYSLRHPDFLQLHVLTLRTWSRIPPTVLGGRGIVVLEMIGRFSFPFAELSSGG